MRRACAKVEAEPTGTLQGQVRGVPPRGIADVCDGPPHVPVEVAGLDGPVPRDERLERLMGGGDGLENIVGCQFHALVITRPSPGLPVHQQACRPGDVPAGVVNVVIPDGRASHHLDGDRRVLGGLLCVGAQRVLWLDGKHARTVDG